MLKRKIPKENISLGFILHNTYCAKCLLKAYYPCEELPSRNPHKLCFFVYIIVCTICTATRRRFHSQNSNGGTITPFTSTIKFYIIVGPKFLSIFLHIDIGGIHEMNTFLYGCTEYLCGVLYFFRY